MRALLDRLAGEVEVERAMEIVAAGVEPLRELIGAMHSKLLLAELRDARRRSVMLLETLTDQSIDSAQSRDGARRCEPVEGNAL